MIGVAALPYRYGVHTRTRFHPVKIAGRLRAVNQKQQLEGLRRKYRAVWDAHQLIADHNARLVQAGKRPSNEQLINEQRAAEAVAFARSELVTAMAAAAAPAAG
jgi:hypothetical protein